MLPIRKRLNLSADNGNETLVFFSKSGLHLATGYTRVVIGGRGPYVEFYQRQMVMNSFSMPEKEEWRINSPQSFYVEYRSKCDSNVKLYVQKRLVKYADYLIGYCYLSAYDLVMGSTCPVVSA